MISVGILGATGYTALELIKILLRHPEVNIVALTTRQEGNPLVSDVHPQLNGRLDLSMEVADPVSVAEKCDCVFSCLPHAASASAILPILDTDTRVVDFSADYRLWDAATYADWYKVEHPDPDRLGTIAYGLPELFREKIIGARLVANPGCYPTSAILAMAPLLKAGLVKCGELIFDSKSGVSGAGRTPRLLTHYPECNENFRAYGVGTHRHAPEIAQILGRACDSPIDVVFTPHLVPMDRGILTTAYAVATESLQHGDVIAALREYYANEPFIRVVDALPGTKDTIHTNFCDVTARVVGSRVITVSCIDNLIKGASGAAVQNMNLMFGFPETTALI